MRPALDDPSEDDLGAGLDAWAAEVLAPSGLSEVGDALAVWRAEVGELRADDPDFDLWAAARADWMLVEQGLGSSTADGALRQRLLRSWVGLFEVWPTDRGGAWLRCRLSGICMSLAGGERIGAGALQRAPSGPAALWEMRGVPSLAGLVPCRSPIAHPLEVVALFGEPARPGFGRPARWLAAARRARLLHGRMPRADPRPVYREALLTASR